MATDFWQCCYTNDEIDVGGVVSSGWRSVAVSPTIDPNVLNTCVERQNGNSAMQLNGSKGKNGISDLYEVFGDKTHIYTLRSRYGLLDRLGRANMFSHALILDWNKSNALLDPNAFLGIEASNYQTCKEDAEAFEGPLSYGSPYTIEMALRESGMSEAGYANLIRCVYVKKTENITDKPLYVFFDGTERQMQQILFCIYWGLPLSLRRTLSVASAWCPNEKNTDLIFCKSIANKALYVVPQSGENSVLNERILAKLNRLGFVDYLATHVGVVDATEYVQTLERIAIRLGDASASLAPFLRVAHALALYPQVDRMSDALLQAHLDNVLLLQGGTEYVDTCLANALDEATRRGMTLSDECEDALLSKLRAMPSESYKERVIEHASSQRGQHKPQALGRCLAYLDERSFERYRSQLMQSAEGQATLDCCYVEKICAGQPSWDLLDTVLAESSYLPSRMRTLSKVDETATVLYRAALKDPAHAVFEYQRYSSLMSRLFEPDLARQRNEAAQVAYWTNMRFGSYDVYATEDHRVMADESMRMQAFESYGSLVRLLLQGQVDVETSLLNVHRFFSWCAQGVIAEHDYVEAAESLRLRMSGASVYDDPWFDSWVYVASYVPSVEALNLLINMRRQMYGARPDECCYTFEGFCACCDQEGGTLSHYAISYAATLLCHLGLDEERALSDFMMPIDLWLMVGERLYDNPFAVFDTYDGAVLHSAHPKTHVRASAFLRRDDYVAYAHDYCESNGAVKDQVQQWLSFVGGKRGRGDANRNITSGIRSLFSRKDP